MRLKYFLATSVAVFGAVPFYANATVTPALSSEGVVAFNNGDTNEQDGSNACFNFSPTGGQTGCTGSVTTPTTGASLFYTTTATADYGVLKAGGSSSISGANGVTNRTDYSQAYGDASFEDSWTITGGTGTGTLELQFSLDGTYDFSQIGSGVLAGFSLINLDGGSSSSGTPSFPSGGPGSISNSVTLTTNFTFGVPLDFLVNLEAGSDLFDLGNDISSSLDLSDTAQMTAIIVTDANGNVIPFNLSTASDASLFSALAPNVAPPASTVPEPTSMALFGVGILGTAIGRRNRRRLGA